MFLNYRRERNFHIHQRVSCEDLIALQKEAFSPEGSTVTLSYRYSKEATGGVSCEDLTALQKEEFSPEGSTVTLSYRYSKTIGATDYFFWYRQYPGKHPEFLIFHWGTKNATNSRLSVKPNEDKTQIYLSISSAAVTDSAVYYCAVEPTVTGNTTMLYKNLCSFSLNIHTLQIPPFSEQHRHQVDTSNSTTSPLKVTHIQPLRETSKMKGSRSGLSVHRLLKVD
ncbi:hypothetical protein NQZ68_038593 [Dissostichus eleginoides]|nr:hypothetical protein NQZ68_038593 [Dissostichus eleginoides]